MKPFKIERVSFGDKRGCFHEISRSSSVGFDFKQLNFVFSWDNVVRGLHYQVDKPQGKLLLVTTGTIWDVAVSPEGEVYKFHLTSGNAVYIPPGYAHGYWTLKPTDVVYMCTEEYDQTLDRAWNPLSKSLPELPWHGVENLLISEKDKNAPEFIKGEMS